VYKTLPFGRFDSDDPLSSDTECNSDIKAHSPIGKFNIVTSSLHFILWIYFYVSCVLFYISNTVMIENKITMPKNRAIKKIVDTPYRAKRKTVGTSCIIKTIHYTTRNSDDDCNSDVEIISNKKIAVTNSYLSDDLCHSNDDSYVEIINNRNISTNHPSCSSSSLSLPVRHNKKHPMNRKV
jgi:hypothetical protein